MGSSTSKAQEIMKTRAGQPGPNRLYLSPSHIERFCEDALRSVGLLPNVPSAIRIERFIEKKFGLTPEYAALPAGVLGYTAFEAGRPMGLVVDRGLAEADSAVAQRRINTTLAHEAGHCLFHAHLFSKAQESELLFVEMGEDSKTPKILCRDEPAARYDGKWWEFQANAAIGPLLLPKDLVLTAVQPFVESRGLLGLLTLGNQMRSAAEVALAEIFEVNPIVARIRLAGLFPPDQQPTL
ncbi:hypothetical protein [Occallatibacter riparius]|uniref:IrrE N-terminal-like domain-containing protein n=1 Tax=Occallatibacter riparius TaxID=1002689 RepID=A0A9J7BRF7_9BACT|nr:hypothetical protein [Occallatibacter riparius]UWZ85256.1 hypothetical protein MOP44_04770 [Occallatibacter riparius]